MLTALVTGSDGFVGRHLIPRLAAAGYVVYATEDLDRYLSMHPMSPNGLTKFDVIVHLAARIVNVDMRARLGMLAYDDIELDMKMCRYVEVNPPTRAFVVMSSCAVDYPDDPYCIVKRTIEAFAKTLVKKGVKTAVLRPYSGYGPDQSLEYPFPAIVDRALHRQDPLEVWSDAIRDWIHIDDLCSAIIMAAEGAFPWGMPIEIGTGVGTSFINLAQRIALEVGYEPTIVVSTDKIGSAHRRVAVTGTARSFGFEAKIKLDEGIKRSVAHFRGIPVVLR
jgi:nucleoside-diphosphate-sugar epimerase